MLTSYSETWCTVRTMEMKADPSHVLMSDVLKGQVPELDDTPVGTLPDKHVIVVAERLIGDKSTPMVGIMRGVLLGPEPELEFRCALNEALDILEANALSFPKFELHHGERIVLIQGPFVVKAARLDEILPNEQLCTLGLHLARPAR